MPSNTSTVTLRFHRSDRSAVLCGRRGKYSLYFIATPSGTEYIVRRKALTEGSKSYAQATALVSPSANSGSTLDPKDLTGIVFEGPAAGRARAYVLASLRAAATRCESRAAGNRKAAAANNARFARLAAGEEISRYSDGSGGSTDLVRMASRDGDTITCELFHSADSYAAAREAKVERDVAAMQAALDAGDETTAKRFGRAKDGVWSAFGDFERCPIATWYLPGADGARGRAETVSLDDVEAAGAESDRLARNYVAGAEAIAGGTEYVEETVQVTAEQVLAVVQEQAERPHHDGRTRTTWVAQALRCPTDTARKHLKALAKAGQVVDAKGGSWRLPGAQLRVVRS